MPAAVSRPLLQPKPLAWPDFATPRDILTDLARQNGLTLEGLDRVPHDLWAAADLPPLSLVERLTLVANQFDLTFALSADGRTVTLAAHSRGSAGGTTARRASRRPPSRAVRFRRPTGPATR